MRWVGGIPDTLDMKLGKHQEMMRDREAWHAAVHGVKKSQTEQQQNMVKKSMCFVVISCL